MPEKKRHAVVIGINKYNDVGIPELFGAENDAEGMYEKLVEFGNFEIPDIHYLRGLRADHTAVRRAISDLLWKTDPVELGLLYFSGHGIRDGYGDGFIAPVDMIKNEPLIHGIRMRELKELILKSKKQCVVVILDCCYSGVITQGEKDLASTPTTFDLDFDDFTNSNTASKYIAEGKYIIASSGEDQKSREIEIVVPGKLTNETRHHGVFTYRMLHGLDGEAADPNGLITLEGLYEHVRKHLTDPGQRPKHYCAESGTMKDVWIAKSPRKFHEYINTALDKATEMIKGEEVLSLMLAADELKKVLDVSREHERAIEIHDEIQVQLEKYRVLANRWLADNTYHLAGKIIKALKELDPLVPSLEYSRLTTLSTREKTMLAVLCDASTQKLTRDRFIERMTYFVHSDSGPSQSWNPKLKK